MISNKVKTNQRIILHRKQNVIIKVRKSIKGLEETVENTSQKVEPKVRDGKCRKQNTSTRKFSI